MAGPNLPNIQTLIQAGIDPTTKLPTKVVNRAFSKANVKAMLRIADEQTAVNRYVWYNLPCNITGQELERMLYYKGQLCFFYDKKLEQFYFMPYALDGTIDFYGRYNTIHPVPMTSGTEDKLGKAQAQYLSNLKLQCVYGINTFNDLTIDEAAKTAVLLHDYSKQLSQSIIPRQQVNDALLDVMAECIPMMRTSLMASSGVKAMRVQDADQEQNVDDANAKIEYGALNGKPFVPVVGTVEFQELTNGNIAKAEEYFLAMKSLDNFRLSSYGIDNGGLFEKKAIELNAEAAINGGPIGLIMQDGLSIRQNFCTIVNSIWSLGIWCEPAQNITKVDLNGDGVVYDRDIDGDMSGVANNVEVEENENAG